MLRKRLAVLAVSIYIWQESKQTLEHNLFLRWGCKTNRLYEVLCFKMWAKVISATRELLWYLDSAGITIAVKNPNGELSLCYALLYAFFYNAGFSRRSLRSSFMHGLWKTMTPNRLKIERGCRLQTFVRTSPSIIVKWGFTDLIARNSCGTIFFHSIDKGDKFLGFSRIFVILMTISFFQVFIQPGDMQKNKSTAHIYRN